MANGIPPTEKKQVNPRSKGDLFGITAISIFFVLVLVGSFFIFHSLRPSVESDAHNPARSVTDFIETLPTEPFLYFGLTILLFLLLYRTFYLSFRNGKETRSQHKNKIPGQSDLSDRDWWVVKELRRRSLSLRLRADLILFGVFVLLFGGIYVVLFVLAEVQQNEEVLEARIQDARFKDKFGRELQALTVGQIWITVDAQKLDDKPDVIFPLRNKSRVDTRVISNILWTKDGGETWHAQAPPFTGERQLTTLALSSNGRTGMVADNNSAVFVTRDGGETWHSPELVLGPQEWIVSTAISDDGETVFLAGDEGSVYVTRDGGTSWQLPDVSPPTDESWINVLVSGNGTIGLLGSKNGSVFVTRDRGASWHSSVTLQLQGELTTLALSSNGRTGVVADNNSAVFVTRDGGETWHSPELALGPQEWIVSTAISDDGETVFLAGDEGSVYVTRDGGTSWQLPDVSPPTDESWINVLVSGNGRIGLLGSKNGSVLVSRDRGVSWRSSATLQLQGALATLALSVNGRTGVVADKNSAVFVTRVGGETWHSPEWALGPQEWIVSTAISDDGETVFLAGNEGSVYVTRDGGASWQAPSSTLRSPQLWSRLAISADGRSVIAGIQTSRGFLSRDSGQSWVEVRIALGVSESLHMSSFSEDGESTLLATNHGRVFLYRNGVEDWTFLDLDLPLQDTLTALVLSKNGRNGVIADKNGSAYLTRDAGDTWHSLELTMRPREWIVSASFSDDGGTVFLAGDEGSAFVTRDGGESWSSPEITPPLGERWIEVVIGKSGINGLIVGDGGSIFVTRDSGRSWLSTEGPDTTEHVIAAFAPATEGQFLGRTENRDYYLLRSYPGLKGWEEQSYSRILGGMRQHNTLVHSDLFRSMSAFDRENSRKFAKNVNERVTGTTGSRQGDATTQVIFNDLRIMQIATLTILFFLVHVLVRLYQYSLRLAAFWESRCDAVLLAGSFSTVRTMSFGELVAAMAPDTYDFKAPPKSPLKWFRSRK